MRLPRLAQVDVPLEIEFTAAGTHLGASAANSVARWISSNVEISITVEMPGLSRSSFAACQVTARLADSGWIARILFPPTSWVESGSVAILSLAVAGRSLPSDLLPATLRVGYNHFPAPAGAVLAAAVVGDVPALQAALNSGGSTEETDEAR